jgi:hypothetical protein
MQLTNETVAAASQIGPGTGFGRRIRKAGSTGNVVRRRNPAVRMRGFNRRSVNNETEQD